jgi:hypothetical protein
MALVEGLGTDLTAGTISVSTSFLDFYSRMKDRPPIERLPHLILGLDPGETTGVCQIVHMGPMLMINQFQRNTSIIEWGVDAYNELIPDPPSHLKESLHYVPDAVVVIESYRIYSWRTKQHTWASLLTPRLIGCAETLCRLKKVPLIQQSAQVGKGFCTDDRLKQWGLYKPGNPHSNDATRHVCQFLLFHQFEFK